MPMTADEFIVKHLSSNCIAIDRAQRTDLYDLIRAREDAAIVQGFADCEAQIIALMNDVIPTLQSPIDSANALRRMVVAGVHRSHLSLDTRSAHAAALGALSASRGGSMNTPAQQAARRENGKKGGRPRKIKE